MLLEVCVDSTEGMLAAVAGGADRIELCCALEVGGLTPSDGQMRRAAGLPVPVHALIRSRAGDFRFGEDEVRTMLDDIRAARAAGLAGVVIGAADDSGRLDVGALRAMKDAAGDLSVTLHRVFDMVPDFDAAVEMAVGLGLDRILTSGGAVGAHEGVAEIGRIVNTARGRIGIMPGAGLTAETVGTLLSAVTVAEVHSACTTDLASDPRAIALGFCGPLRARTDAREVAALKTALAHYS